MGIFTPRASDYFLKRSNLIIPFALQAFLLVSIPALLLFDDLYISRNVLMFLYLECVLISFLGRAGNIFQIFLALVFIFNLANPFFEILGLYNYPVNNLMLLGDGMTRPISDQVLNDTYIAMCAFLVGSSVGWVLSLLTLYSRDKPSFHVIFNYGSSFSLSGFISVIFYVTFFMVVVRSVLLTYYASRYGYVDVIHSHKTELNIPLIFELFELFYKLVGSMFVFYRVNQKDFIRRSLIFIIPFWILFLAGSRGEAIAVTLALVLIYTHHYRYFKITKYIKYFLILFVFGVLMGSYRFMDNPELILLIPNIIELSLFHFVGNASSLAVLSYTIVLQDEFFNSVPFLFGYIDSLFSFAPNYTVEGVMQKNYLAQHLTYLLNPEKLFRGSTVGTAQVAEFYELVGGSIYLLGLVSALYLFVSQFFLRIIFNNPILFYVGLTYFEFFILSPRGSVFKFINKESVVMLAIVVFISLIIKFYKTRRHPS